MLCQPLIQALRERRQKAHQRWYEDHRYMPELALVWA